MINGMAPGIKEKLQMKNKFSTSQSDCGRHASKKVSPKFVTLGGIKGVLGKTNMASDGKSISTRNETLVQNISSKRCGTTTTQLSSEREDTGSIQSHESAANCSPHITSPETHVEGAPRSKKRGRGQTMGKGIMKAFEASKTKMKITVDPSVGRPKNGEQSAKLSSQIGIVTSDVIPVPRRWKEVDEENELGPGLDHIQMHMDVNVGDPGVKESLIERLKNSSRQMRYKLHKHYRQFGTMEMAKSNKPDFCLNQENWESLCEHFASPKFKFDTFDYRNQASQTRETGNLCELHIFVVGSLSLSEDKKFLNRS
ncbi:unnamed protein product [Cuscuta epithymum]|uniref:Uncharacterized protein n=1 Tax=Cuscuta epithymum TaxID=186058 RepID=A0AAV0FAE6_9ASTE|nr:unnamed protein product [Cuscuta epithymum]